MGLYLNTEKQRVSFPKSVINYISFTKNIFGMCIKLGHTKAGMKPLILLYFN